MTETRDVFEAIIEVIVGLKMLISFYGGKCKVKFLKLSHSPLLKLKEQHGTPKAQDLLDMGIQTHC
jgi:hypothetical protein